MGVFATRSTFRPNGLGLSVVKLERIESVDHKVRLHVSGLDLLDQTPIVDIKPYLPYADALPHAYAGIMQSPPQVKEVSIPPHCIEQVHKLCKDAPQTLLQLIIEVLQQDPRPAHRQAKEDLKEYFTTLEHLNIQWQCREKTIYVLNIDTHSP